MNDILTDLSHQSLVGATKRNLYEFFGYMRHWGKTEFYVAPGHWRWWTPIPYPWFNAVLSIQPPSADETALIAEMLDYFKSKGNRAITWWLAPDVESSNWGKQLEANGLIFASDPPGMAADLETLNEDLPKLEGLEITRVQDEETMITWASVFITGFELPQDWTPDMLDMMLALAMDAPMQNYLATVNGEAVATSSIFFGAGAAGIYCVSTLPDWRGKGIGAVVTLQPLLEARLAGYRVGVLQSSAMGFKVYQRMGFREVCRMSHYYWQQP